MTPSRPSTCTPAHRIGDDPSPPLAALAAIDRAHPDARKLVLGPDVNYGREPLFSHARRTGAGRGLLREGWTSNTMNLRADFPDLMGRVAGRAPGQTI